MGAYHQIGHDSENLLFEPELGQFSGAILSPVNYGPSKTQAQVARALEDLKSPFDLILDPQLYVPQSSRGRLHEWQYFPTDVDTADLSLINWWASVNEALVQEALAIGASGVASPLTLPRSELYSDEYLAFVVQTCSDLVRRADRQLEVWQTAVIGMRELNSTDRPMQIASLLSNTAAERIYLVFSTDVTPRQELHASDELAAAVTLVSELKNAGLKVLVGFCSADMVLWKAAGAESCATGKFFNLRRFTRSRWLEPSENGGGQLPYLFEEGLLAFLREADVTRLSNAKMLTDVSSENPFTKRILHKFAEQPGSPWLADSWRQYLYWFAECENQMTDGTSVRELLADAENCWSKLDDIGLLFEERRNDGRWVRPWRIAEKAAR